MALFPTPAVSAFADVIIALLREQPETWSLEYCRLRHPSGLAIWVANGFWFIALDAPEKLHFGWKKILVWLACKPVIRAAKKRDEAEQTQRLVARLRGVSDNIIQFRREA